MLLVSRTQHRVEVQSEQAQATAFQSVLVTAVKAASILKARDEPASVERGI